MQTISIHHAAVPAGWRRGNWLPEQLKRGYQLFLDSGRIVLQNPRGGKSYSYSPQLRATVTAPTPTHHVAAPVDRLNLIESLTRHYRAMVQTSRTTLLGYVTTWDTASCPMPDGASIIMRRGAFDGVLRGATKCLVNHRGQLTCLGRTWDGTLQLRADEYGLAAFIRPPWPTLGIPLLAVEAIADGELSGMSFALRSSPGGSREFFQGGQRFCEVFKLNSLPEISVVDRPANPSTLVLCVNLPESSGRWQRRGIFHNLLEKVK